MAPPTRDEWQAMERAFSGFDGKMHQLTGEVHQKSNDYEQIH